MLTPKQSLRAEERRLLELYRALGERDRHALERFAAFLADTEQPAAGSPREDAITQEPVPHPRPETETVIAAIRRLGRTYPMLERGAMLNDTSALMHAHVLQGRAASEVIDELELLFERHYRRHRGEDQNP